MDVFQSEHTTVLFNLKGNNSFLLAKRFSSFAFISLGLALNFFQRLKILVWVLLENLVCDGLFSNRENWKNIVVDLQQTLHEKRTLILEHGDISALIMGILLGKFQFWKLDFLHENIQISLFNYEIGVCYKELIVTEGENIQKRTFY